MEYSGKQYRRDSWLGALGAALMLVGDLCLSVIPASPADSGLFQREAYFSGSWEPWRLPLLLAAGLSAWRSAFSPCACPTGRSGRSIAGRGWPFWWAA